MEDKDENSEPDNQPVPVEDDDVESDNQQISAEDVYAELENLLAHAEDEQTVAKLRSRLSDNSFEDAMFKSMRSGAFQEFVESHEPLSDFVHSGILVRLLSVLIIFSSFASVSLHQTLTVPNTLILWTKTPSVSLIDQLSTLLLGLSPVLRDCRVISDAVSPHTSVLPPG
ncbi:hypothetical protein BLNAU_13753 [Blattamonas nauphoetae]|uniref:Uncharacterized protein n=1 Tax=Blattamonas nauphoetae TaxID=2049346 RepID=A0ABQ9XLX9_9EUKA|nr:hypothetical protein BLNAU_13753 [Blattamonas nauphoetae]